MQQNSRFQLFQFIFKENNHVVISWESKIGLGSLQVQLSINRDFFPETPNVYSIYFSYFFESVIYIKFLCVRTKVFFTILVASDSHKSYLYSLHVPNLLSVSETIFPSPEVKNWKDALQTWVGQNLETGLVKRLKTALAMGHNSVGDTAPYLRTEREPFPKLTHYQRRTKSRNTVMLIVYHAISRTSHKSFSSSP